MFINGEKDEEEKKLEQIDQLLMIKCNNAEYWILEWSATTKKILTNELLFVNECIDC